MGINLTERQKTLQAKESQFLSVKNEKTDASNEVQEKPRFAYGKIRNFDNGTTLWFEPISDEEDGFVLRKTGSLVESIFSEIRETCIMDRKDPNVIAVYGPLPEPEDK